MKLIIKNKFVSLRGSSTVTDEMGEDVFVVKGKMFSLSNKKFICDLQGNRLYIVRNKLLPGLLHAAYIYDGEKNKIGKLQIKVALTETYKLENGTDRIEIKKSKETKELQFIKNDEVIGVLLKRTTSSKDSFVVDCLKDTEAALLTSLVIAIDNIEDNIADD